MKCWASLASSAACLLYYEDSKKTDRRLNKQKKEHHNPKMHGPSSACVCSTKLIKYIIQ